MSNYMFNNKSLSSQRRKREEQQVELRRQRTEELLNKKREATQKNEGGFSFVGLRNRLYSSDLNEIHKAAYECRMALSTEHNPPIQNVLDAGLLGRCAEMLSTSFYNNLENYDISLVKKTRVEAAWIITNIASGTSEQTAAIVEVGCVPLFVNMLKEGDDTVVDQAVWALGNIAGDCEMTRDSVLHEDIIPILEGLVEKYSVSKNHIKILRNLVWLIANLSRGRNPPPETTVMETIEHLVRKLVFIDDKEVVMDCFWSLSYIADVSKSLTNVVLNSAVIRRAHDLLGAFSRMLLSERTDDADVETPHLEKIGMYTVCPIIRMLGNMITNSDEATDAIIQGGFLDFFRVIYYNYYGKRLPRIRKEICWVLSNVTAGTPEQVEYVINGDFLGMLVESLTKYELYVKKEACYAVKNMLFYCAHNHNYLQRLLDHNVLYGLQSLMDAVLNFPDMLVQILDSVKYALEAGEEIRKQANENPVVREMIDSGFVDQIENLQDTHAQNESILDKAYKIIIDYFEGEDVA